MRQLMDMDISEETVFKIKASHILEYEAELYYQLIYFPAEMICCFDELLRELFARLFIEDLVD